LHARKSRLFGGFFVSGSLIVAATVGFNVFASTPFHLASDLQWIAASGGLFI
jgi:hypothetical protein